VTRRRLRMYAVIALAVAVALFLVLASTVVLMWTLWTSDREET